MTIRFRSLPMLFAIVLNLLAGSAHALDHQYQSFNRLLAAHVEWNEEQVATTVDYAGFKLQRDALAEVLTEFSAVTKTEYDGFSRDQQLAFLINAYNAFTVELILTRYPDLESIKDLGNLFRSPWKKKFFSLLGDKRSLDWIEHSMIRAKGVFDEPRIHFVVNCASIGCPALRPEALLASRLEQQLEDSTERFFHDRTRNRFDASGNTLRVSKLLDWYADDFKPVKQFLARYAMQFSKDPIRLAGIQARATDVAFLPYDWRLNNR